MEECLGCAAVMLQREMTQRLFVGRREAERLLAAGVVVRLRRGVVVGACQLERARGDQALAHRIRLEALLLAYPDCAASNESAALLRRLPVFRIPPYVIGTRTRGAWRGGADARVRVAPLPSDHVTVVDGWACTSDARSVVDIARTGSLADALVVGDAALRAGCSRQLLTSTLADCATWSDVERARKAVPLVSDLSESPLESLSRALMHEHGVPKPELQVSVLDGRYRVDFYWRKQRVVGEADGANKYGEPGALFLEKVREDEIREEYGVVRWTYKQMVWDTDLTIARIMRKLAGR